MFGEDPDLTGYSRRFSEKEEIILQTKSMINTFSIQQQVSKKKYHELLNNKLPKEMNLFAQHIYQTIFKDKDFNSLKIKQQQDYLDNFQMKVDINSNYSKIGDEGYYARNRKGAENYYISEIINIVIIFLLFIIVITILFSIINSKIKDNYKQFGVLKSFGYSTKTISLSFLMFPIILMIVNNVFALSFAALFY